MDAPAPPVARVTSLVEDVLAADPAAPHALRALERIARAAGSAAMMANALAQQADAFGDDAPKLGALWAEAAIVEWKLPDGDPTGIADAILERAPFDRAALALAVRLASPKARAGDPAARTRLIAGLRGQLAHAPSGGERLAAHLALGAILDPEPAAPDEATARPALLHYRKALEIDPRSVVAAEGAARLGAALGDVEAVIAAALAHADLTDDPKRRAAQLVLAAGQTLSGHLQPPRPRSESLLRAGEMLERALAADPEALPALALLIRVRSEDGMGRDRLMDVLRDALARARSALAVAQIGTELARLASLDPPDRLLAVDVLRRVLAADPGNPGALRALADHAAAMSNWGDAVDALERMVASVRDPRARALALFDLADVYGKRLARPVDVERVLRAVLDIDPTSAEGLRRILSHRRAEGAPPLEIASWLARLGDAEEQPEPKALVLTELAELRSASGDVASAEKALVEATAQAATPARIARLLALFPSSPADQGRALALVVARAKDLDRPDAQCLLALGRLEVDALGRAAAGVGHLRAALVISPALHEARAALARGLTRARGGGEAVGLVLPMIVPDAAPLLSLADPTETLLTLETAFAGEGRPDDALVARELRAIAGGLDDGAHADLRSRRHVVDPAAPVPVVFDSTIVRTSIVPEGVPALLLDVAAAIAGVAGKFARVDVADLGVSPRDRLTGHPLMVYRLAKTLGIEPPDVVVSPAARRARAVAHEVPWVLIPEALLAQPEPVQIASLAAPLLRIALGVPWLEDLRGVDARAVFCGAARQVIPDYADDAGDATLEARIDDFTRRIGRAIGRRHKKALQEIAPAARRDAPAVPGRRRGVRTRHRARRAAYRVPLDRRPLGDARRPARGRPGAREGHRRRGQGRAGGHPRAPPRARPRQLCLRPRHDRSPAQGRNDLVRALTSPASPYSKMFTARARMTTTVTSESPAWIIMRILALEVSGQASLGLKATDVLNAMKT
jgi:tetratricopeptide (TPR) repeat protein